MRLYLRVTVVFISVLFVEGRTFIRRARSAVDPTLPGNGTAPIPMNCMFRVLLRRFYYSFPDGPIQATIQADPHQMYDSVGKTFRFYKVLRDKQLAMDEMAKRFTGFVWRSHTSCAPVRFHQVISILASQSLQRSTHIRDKIVEKLRPLGFGYEVEFATEVLREIDSMILVPYRRFSDGLFKDLQKAIGMVLQKTAMIIEGNQWRKEANEMFDDVGKAIPSATRCISLDEVIRVHQQFIALITSIVNRDLQKYLDKIKEITTHELKAITSNDTTQAVDAIVNILGQHIKDFIKHVAVYENAIVAKDLNKIRGLLSMILPADEVMYVNEVIKMLKNPGTGKNCSIIPTVIPVRRGRPRPTEQPETRGRPRPTEQPDTRGRPRPTEQPETRGRPRPTEQPETRGRPRPTEQPETRGRPRPTEQPETRGRPRPTEQPETRGRPRPTGRPGSGRPRPTGRPGSGRSRPTEQPETRGRLRPTEQPETRGRPRPTKQPETRGRPRPTGRPGSGRPRPTGRPGSGRPRPTGKPKATATTQSVMDRVLEQLKQHERTLMQQRIYDLDEQRDQEEENEFHVNFDGSIRRLGNPTGMPRPTGFPRIPHHTGPPRPTGVLPFVPRPTGGPLHPFSGKDDGKQALKEFIMNLTTVFPSGPMSDTFNLGVDDIVQKIKTDFQQYPAMTVEDIMNKLRLDLGISILTQRSKCPASKFAHAIIYMMRMEMEHDLGDEDDSLKSKLVKILSTTALTDPTPDEYAEDLVESLHHAMFRQIVFETARSMTKDTHRALKFLIRIMRPRVTKPFNEQKTKKIVQAIVHKFPKAGRCVTAQELLDWHKNQKTELDQIKERMNMTGLPEFLRYVLTSSLKNMTGKEYPTQVQSMLDILKLYLDDVMDFAEHFYDQVIAQDMDNMLELFDLDDSQKTYFKAILVKLGFASAGPTTPAVKREQYKDDLYRSLSNKWNPFSFY